MSIKEPVDKLPLAVRKNLRDEFEAKKADLEAQLSKRLGGQAWTINADPKLIYAYAEDGSYGQTSLGSCITAYVEGALYRLDYFLDSQNHGDEGVAEINTLASTHSLTLYPDLEKKHSYCGVDIHEGALRILFREGSLGVNVNSALEYIERALNEASKSASPTSLSYTARNSIKQDYTAKIEEVEKDVQAQAHNDELKLKPNFEAIAEKLKTGKDIRDDWERNLGDFTRSYFEGLLYYMKYNKFMEDDLMYEGFNDAVSKNEVVFRVVDKLTGPSSYNQCLIEDGALVLQTTPANFGTNVTYVAEKIVDIL